MTPVGEIRAAIEKLTELRSESKPGPWTHTWGSATIPAADDLASEDADLIVTLHRTIDAQLNILRGEVTFCKVSGFSPSGNKVDLARAINGPA